MRRLCELLLAVSREVYNNVCKKAKTMAFIEKGNFMQYVLYPSVKTLLQYQVHKDHLLKDEDALNLRDLLALPFNNIRVYSAYFDVC